MSCTSSCFRRCKRKNEVIYKCYFVRYFILCFLYRLCHVSCVFDKRDRVPKLGHKTHNLFFVAQQCSAGCFLSEGNVNIESFYEVYQQIILLLSQIQ